jgi:hypothetical protein
MNARVSVKKTVLVLLALVVLYPSLATAQSAISGVVKDESGGVLPGVTVEAASSALIEKARTVVTDDQGRYSVVDLRPGTYKVTFTLTGFSTFVRDNIDLPGNFTATINVDMKLGGLEQAVTVTGQSPIVDVTNAQRTVVVTRDLIDAVPTMRNFAPVANLSVGVQISAPNVGGTRTTSQQRLVVHGSFSKDTTIFVDGMNMNAFGPGDDTQGQHNDAMTEEVTVKTSGAGAEVSAGGVSINLIPRQGSNELHGGGYFGWSSGGMQGHNLTQALRNRGLKSGDRLDYTYDINPWAGGPIRQDRLWFFLSFRAQNNGNFVANAFHRNGSPAVFDTETYNYTLRLTTQLTPRNKLTAYIDRSPNSSRSMIPPGVDPDTAAGVRPQGQLFYTSAVKWTAPISSRLLVEAGVSAHVVNNATLALPGIQQPYGSPAWYAGASRTDLLLGTTYGAVAIINHNYTPGYGLASSASYVTGTHNFNVGLQLLRVYRNHVSNDATNADLQERFRNGVPDSVLVYNTPTAYDSRMNADAGIYAQDAWTLGALTLSPGVRFEHFHSSVQAIDLPAGRFVPARSFPAIPNVPKWFDVSPRLGLAYSLTKDGKTALKASVGKYVRHWTHTFASTYAAGNLQSDIRNWKDCALIPGTSNCDPALANLPTNGDGIAQDWEIGPSNNAAFGQTPPRSADPKISREYDMQYSIAVDRQLLRGLSVTGAWYRKDTYNRQVSRNTLIGPQDYTAFQTPNPLQNGEILTLYNLNPSKQGLVNIVDITAPDRRKNRAVYNGFELSFTGRIPGGGSVLGGLALNKLGYFVGQGLTPLTVTCDGTDPNSLRFCDQTALHVPYGRDFKLNGSYPLWLGFEVGATFQSYQGQPRQILWTPAASVFPGGQRTQTEVIPLLPLGAQYLDRWNQLDLRVAKQIKFGKFAFKPSLELYNALNGNAVLLENFNFGPALGTPQAILQPRLLRISGQILF